VESRHQFVPLVNNPSLCYSSLSGMRMSTLATPVTLDPVVPAPDDDGGDRGAWSS
jgi:hypothetical protein